VGVPFTPEQNDQSRSVADAVVKLGVFRKPLPCQDEESSANAVPSSGVAAVFEYSTTLNQSRVFEATV
jgi:hypothetical protein